MDVEPNTKQTNSESSPDSDLKVGGGPKIGVDEWVAQADQRRRQRRGFWGAIANLWEAIPLGGRIALVTVVLILVPLVTNTAPVLSMLGISNNSFMVRVGATFLAFSILAIGLNVVVGYAGLLDLGYIAFFGLAGYAYAYISSDFIGNGIHVPSIISLPLVVAFTALVGWLLGSLSIRLYGDYLAIVTLGFGLLFVQLTTTLTRVRFFWLDRPVDLTRGPNGINNVDEIVLFGYEFKSTLQYYYLFLVLLGLVVLVVHHLNQSRLGRAWRAMHEDELAADVMGMPTRRLKLMAFATGAAIAALAGTVFAAWQGNVVPIRYSTLALINLYAIVVLGGLGSLPGVIIGAFIFTVLPEILRNVEMAGILVYAGTLIGLIWWLKPSKRLIGVLGGTIVAGVLLKLVVNMVWPGLDAGVAPTEGSIVNQWVQSWLIIPANFKITGNIVIGVAILTLLLTLLIKNEWRWLLLSLTLYLFAFAWETRLATEPAVTRILVLGTSLVVLMITRPQGLLGKLRVQIV
jgi:branched-chain amino acid transport system permease protein